MRLAVAFVLVLLPAAFLSSAQQATTPKRIRVGSPIVGEKLIHQVPPKYPAKARRAHVQGDVLLKVLIGKDGRVRSLKTLSGDPMLAEAATKAVKKWRYEPILLNGEPVEVITEIHVNFQLSR